METWRNHWRERSGLRPWIKIFDRDQNFLECKKYLWKQKLRSRNRYFQEKQVRLLPRHKLRKVWSFQGTTKYRSCTIWLARSFRLDWAGRRHRSTSSACPHCWTVQTAQTASITTAFALLTFACVENFQPCRQWSDNSRHWAQTPIRIAFLSMPQLLLFQTPWRDRRPFLPHLRTPWLSSLLLLLEIVRGGKCVLGSYDFFQMSL